MDNDLATQMRNKAGENFRNGYNCAESIFIAFRELLAPDIDPTLARMFTGFGGGLGHAGCMCGALTASAAMLGLLKGRISASEDRDGCYKLTQELHDRFEQKFSATCCRVLNPHPFDTKEHLKNCLKITGNTAKLLTEYLMEKGLLPQGK
ncbi:C-GCAxxG-C-C family protein [Desulfoscipio geothermicus]|uniref:C_GCAxxG_C_C family probable redox protein n=1 Tax=Desulfoscipio geothermicus DSM 3669 TaxID=1121426 RepID=A0A1I6D627_9FIRM|nr:C-GCAxxG-C-C family protein [Desulfoscipio geothermicus]SFR00934.1 C_GCAxxG_C_C family probable redox protein [Desulfoscipio geothermicus DSM 3669]